MTFNTRSALYYLALAGLLAGTACSAGESKISKGGNPDEMDRIELVRNDADKRVDVMIDGKLFTSYIYPDTLEKPVLYPINTANGTPVTRGFPLAPRPGERIDHPHHVGLWFNYGDVDGLDFWNNSSAIPESEKGKYGRIVHTGIRSIESGKDQATLEVSMEWRNNAGEVILTEDTRFVFSGGKDRRVIDRVATLRAGSREVSLKDNKEGMLGLRVARELEHPSDKPELFTDASGKVTDVPSMNNEGVTGKYLSSEGIEEHDVWGTRGDWVSLSGKIKDENVSVVMFDYPSNPGHPTYWHARGYGLFAANPLGQKALSGGKDELNFKIAPNQSAIFKYRIIVYSNEEVLPQNTRGDYIEWAK